jgi:uncharacterized membrane protein YqhA
MNRISKHPKTTKLGLIIILISFIAFAYAFINPKEYTQFHYTIIGVVFCLGILVMFAKDKLINLILDKLK